MAEGDLEKIYDGSVIALYSLSRGLIKRDVDQWKRREKRIKRESLEKVFICSWIYLFRDYFIEDLLRASCCYRSWSYFSEQNTKECRGASRWADPCYLHFETSWHLPLTVLFQLPAVNGNLQPQSSWEVFPGCHAVDKWPLHQSPTSSFYSSVLLPVLKLL